VPNLAASLPDLRQLDLLASGGTPLHRLDPRVLLLTTLLFSATIVSFDRYEVVRLLPFSLYPAVLVGAGRLPVAFILRQAMVPLSLALTLVLANPILDRSVPATSFPLTITGGWLSLCSVLLKTLLTVSSALMLVALTGMPRLTAALSTLRVPRPLQVQLLLLHRYLFLLGEELGRMEQARAMRSSGRRSMPLRQRGAMLGSLLLRTLGRGERVHAAMLCRGFGGRLPLPSLAPPRLTDLLFLSGWGALFLLLRLVDLPTLLGGLLTAGGGP
jgi:cobalt/nickel transport system permease protein